MKTTIRQIAAGTFLVLIFMGGNVKAIETKASSCEMVETTLQLEKWMTDDLVWNSNSLNIAKFAVETEPDMQLENWMTNTEYWNLNNNFIVEVENEMELESWMINDTTWSTVNNDNESDLIVENWMINDNLWK